MNGSLSIEKRTIRFANIDAQAFIAAAAVGVLAGIAVTYARTPLHLPGHKVIWWMTPLLATRIITGTKLSVLVGALATAITALLLGGRIGGGAAMLPLIVVAAAMLDAAAAFVELRKLSVWFQILLFGATGLAGNLFCSVRKLADAAGWLAVLPNRSDFAEAAISYAAFGLVAGFLGAMAGLCIAASTNLKNDSTNE